MPLAGAQRARRGPRGAGGNFYVVTIVSTAAIGKFNAMGLVLDEHANVCGTSHASSLHQLLRRVAAASSCVACGAAVTACSARPRVMWSAMVICDPVGNRGTYTSQTGGQKQPGRGALPPSRPRRNQRAHAWRQACLKEQSAVITAHEHEQGGFATVTAVPPSQLTQAAVCVRHDAWMVVYGSGVCCGLMMECDPKSPVYELPPLIDFTSPPAADIPQSPSMRPSLPLVAALALLVATHGGHSPATVWLPGA